MGSFKGYPAQRLSFIIIRYIATNNVSRTQRGHSRALCNVVKSSELCTSLGGVRPKLADYRFRIHPEPPVRRAFVVTQQRSQRFPEVDIIV